MIDGCLEGPIDGCEEGVLDGKLEGLCDGATDCVVAAVAILMVTPDWKKPPVAIMIPSA